MPYNSELCFALQPIGERFVSTPMAESQNIRLQAKAAVVPSVITKDPKVLRKEKKKLHVGDLIYAEPTS